jgi:hypothetical protein
MLSVLRAVSAALSTTSAERVTVLFALSTALFALSIASPEFGFVLFVVVVFVVVFAGVDGAGVVEGCTTTVVAGTGVWSAGFSEQLIITVPPNANARNTSAR